MPAPIPDGDLWRVDFRVGGRNGTRYRRAFPSQKDADDFIARVLAGNAPSQAATLPGLVDEYIRWAEKIKGKAPATVRCDRARLKVFEVWARDQIRRPVDVDFKAMAAFQRYFFENSPFDKARIHKRYKQLNTAATWEKYRQILSAFFVWCIKRGHAKDNPAADPEFKTKQQRNIPPHFKPDDLVRVFEYFDQRDVDLPAPWLSTIYRVLAYTGMRLGELQALAWADVDLPGGYLNIRRSKNKGVRTIPINPRLRPWLERLPRAGALVFDNGHGERLYSDSWILRELVAACRDLKIPRRRVHDLRHTFAASLARARVSLPEIQKLMGHESIQSSLVYIVFMADDLRRAVESVDY